jgi:hypothetical protein
LFRPRAPGRSAPSAGTCDMTRRALFLGDPANTSNVSSDCSHGICAALQRV